MKHLPFILCALLMVGCIPTKPTQGATRGKVSCVNEFSYNGHDYLVFKDHGFRGQGVVHNPECKKCLQAYD